MCTDYPTSYNKAITAVSLHNSFNASEFMTWSSNYLLFDNGYKYVTVLKTFSQLKLTISSPEIRKQDKNWPHTRHEMLKGKSSSHTTKDWEQRELRLYSASMESQYTCNSFSSPQQEQCKIFKARTSDQYYLLSLALTAHDWNILSGHPPCKRTC